MPLDGEDGLCFVAYCFHRSILCPCDHLQSLAGTVDGLMVRAVGDEALAVEPAEHRVVGAHCVDAVGAADLVMAADVLAQRAAEGNVDELRPTADAEDGPAGVIETAKECKLVLVARLVDLRRSAELLTVEARVDIPAAGEQQRVTAIGLIALDRRAQRFQRVYVGLKR